MATRKQSVRDQAAARTFEDYGEIIDRDTLGPALGQIKSRLGIADDAAAQVYVYRVNADGEGHDFRVWESNDPDSFNLKTIAQKFGSGGYRVAVYMPDAEGVNALRINSTQHILLTPEEESKVMAAKEAAKNPATAVHAGGDFQGAVQSMMAGFQSTVAQILDAHKAAPAPDPFAMVERLAGVMKAMAPAAPAVAAVDPMSNIKSTLELIALLKGAAGGDGMSASEQLLMKAADSFLPAVAAGLSGKQSNAPAAGAAGAAALPAPVMTEQIDEEENDMKVMAQLKFQAFKMQLKAANKAAARGVPADAYADTIYDAFEDDDIRGLATEAAWFDLMCNAVPECAPHKAWYDSVRAAVIEMAVEDGLLVRDAAGGLTAAPDSGTTTLDSEPGAALGTSTVGDSDTGAVST